MTYISVQTVSRKPRAYFYTICFLGIVIFVILTVTYDFSKILDKKYILHERNITNSDYNRLMNISFNFLHAPLVCNESALFIVMIHTAPQNFERRKAIRETWGNETNNVTILFVVGTVANEVGELKQQLDEEIKQYDDFVQGDFFDSYHNLTYKHVMLLKYFFYHCPKVDYLVKVDDDMFINTPSLKIFLYLYHYQFKNKNDIICNTLYANPVLRGGKWGVPREEYGSEYYPGHCSGFTIIYPHETVARLYAEAQRTKYFWIDDVFVSGILAKKAAIAHINLQNLLLTDAEVNGVVRFSFTNITRPFLLGGFDSRPDQIRHLWKFVEAHNPKNSILDYLRPK